ncbi:MAG: leucyl aminopeptidase [Burkholderiaceae bacterium]
MNVELKALSMAQAARGAFDAVVLLRDANAPAPSGSDALSAWLGQVMQAKALAQGGSVAAFALPGVRARHVVVLDVAHGAPAATRRAVATVFNSLRGDGVRHAAIVACGLSLEGDTLVRALEATVLGADDGWYRYETTRGRSAKRVVARQLTLGVARVAGLRDMVARAQAIVHGMAFTREWANRPANHATPTMLADAVKPLARRRDVRVDVLGPREVARLGMGAFMAVAQGSREPLRLVVVRYQGAAAQEPPVALVGKGITFDTGGISLKPAPEMDEMKFDMCGAAAVLGAMHALVELKPKLNVVAVVAACENMPDGAAVKPGDVVTSMSGQTIEILNTDAEGRLVLCDALTYVQRFKPRHVVDVATLTGACVVALGHVHTGMYADDDALADSLLHAGQATGDSCWRMPLDEVYADALKTPFADVANVGGGRAGGSVTAAKFLQRFVKGFAWAHLDIAGTAWRSGAAKGATARPVALLVHHVLSQVGVRRGRRGRA